MLDMTRDGLHQMALCLRQRSALDAIHVVCHGARGTLTLGRAEIRLGDRANDVAYIP